MTNTNWGKGYWEWSKEKKVNLAKIVTDPWYNIACKMEKLFGVKECKRYFTHPKSGVIVSGTLRQIFEKDAR